MSDARGSLRYGACTSPGHRALRWVGRSAGATSRHAVAVVGLPGLDGELIPDGLAVRVRQARNLLAYRQQRGEQIPGGGRVARLPINWASS